MTATLEDLLIDELEDIYSAEKQILKALPKMSRAASSEGLKRAFDDHLAESERHVSRLERVFEELGAPAKAKTCKGMKGLLAEGAEMMKKGEADSMLRDASLIAAAQRVEHYEMAAYGTARAHCEILGRPEAAKILQETLEEEKKADHHLTELAMSCINIEAAVGANGNGKNESEE